MKIHALGVLQLLALSVSAESMVVEFADTVATNWDALLASDLALNGAQLIAGDDDNVTNTDTAAPELVVNNLRQDGEPSVFDDIPTSVLSAANLIALDDDTDASAVVNNLRQDGEPSVFNDQSLLLAQSTNRDALSPRTVLLADTLPSGSQCSYTGSVSTQPVNVLIALSSCYSNYGQALVDNWIASLKEQDTKYFEGSTARPINFVTKFVDDGCNCHLDSLSDRFNPNDPMSVVAVISIMVYQKGANTVQSYVSAKNIPTFLKYVYYCPPQLVTPISGYQAIRFYNDNGKLLMDTIDPYTVSRTIHCKDMAGGVPNSYIDATGKRQCFCDCPENYELKNGACTPVVDPNCQCPWEKAMNGGYKFEVGDVESAYKSASGNCVIKNLVNSGLLGVPVPRDNYVDYIRTNDGDSVNPLTAASPHIDLTKQKMTVSVKQGTNPAASETGDVSPSTSSYTWKDFQTSSTAKINSLEFNYVGKYSLGLVAKDYNSGTATCNGCLAVVDARRPSINPSYPCPASVNTVTSELTIPNIRKAQNAVDAVGLLKVNALNDPCSPNVRCDDDSLKLKRFVDADYQAPASSISGVSTWFAKEVVKSDLSQRLAVRPLDTTGKLVSTVTDVCKRCASLSTKLKEWWTPYSCSPTATSPFVSQCDGVDAAKCAIEQCVQLNGKTVATGSASLTDSIKATSKTVVKNLNNDEATSDEDLKSKYKLDTTVHVALTCSAFPTSGGAYGGLLATEDDDQITAEVCSYSAKIGELITTAADRAVSAATASDALFTSDEVRNFVSWRYNIDSGAWKPWSATTQETFTKALTSITIEAWTQCGIVATFTFKVELHLNNVIRVCDHFDDMWYQTTVAPQFVANQQFCLFPKSDFAEITFDYHPNIGIDYDVDKFKMGVSSVSCTLNYDGKNAVPIVTSADVPSSFEIVKEFSVNALSVATTKASTQFSVTCQFQYSRKPDNSVVTQQCTQKFTLKDCEIPVINKPCELDGRCDFNKCAKSNTAKPDLYQVCGGNRISQSSTGQTTIATNDIACCDSCDTAYYSTKCVPINNIPLTSGIIKRCEAIPKSTPLLAMANINTEEHGVSTIATGLLAASALVAIVAMIVVKRRHQQVLEEDVYYHLMN